MFLEKDIEIEETSPCMADKTKFKAITRAEKDLGELLPYMNGILPNASYRRGSISFQREGIGYTIMDCHINITKYDNLTHLYEILDWLKDWINDIYNRREEIVPCDVLTKYPSPIEIYRLLPKSNCGKCGSSGCMAFAGRLSRRKAEIKDCPAATNEMIRAIEALF